MIIIADSGPIIHLSKIGRLDLLKKLYERLFVPKAVHDEVVVHGAGRAGSAELAAASWVEIVDHDPADRVFRLLRGTLGEGESAALSVAVARQVDLVLLDDREARAAAERLSLSTKGTLGVLIDAKSRREIDAVGPLLRGLLDRGVWFSPRLVRDVLLKLKEDPWTE